jgi:hypothetical protein
LEYLSTEQRSRQKEIAVKLLSQRPASVLQLIERFAGEL